MSKQIGSVKIAAITGSVRPNNMTAKALALVIDELKKYRNVSVELIDPGKLRLGASGVDCGSSVASLQGIVSGAAGVIMATPEYHGSYSSAIKLVIDNLGFPSALAGKPVALLGVASGAIGAIKALEHLRSVCAHIGCIVLPASVSVAGIDKLFDKQGRCMDKKMEKRIRALAVMLVEYIRKHILPSVTLEETVRDS